MPLVATVVAIATKITLVKWLYIILPWIISNLFGISFITVDNVLTARLVLILTLILMSAYKRSEIH
jgi:hypothetical protein